ncbi:MAG: gamma-glutamylcyclotransferase [Alphaproteobacteria bacterium]|nr:gamma-glutamylcyclotransferase [Alphaproteobacteria bacterium]
MFFFGTLLDPDVRRVVLGRPLPDEATPPAALRGFRRVGVAGRDYPCLLPHPTGLVLGRLACGLDQPSVHRLMVFEGREYHLVPLTVATPDSDAVRAWAFLSCRFRVEPHARDWSLEAWRRRHKRAFLRRILRVVERRCAAPPPVPSPPAPKLLLGRPPRMRMGHW